MINLPEKRYYQDCYGLSLFEYISKKRHKNRRINFIIFSIIISLLTVCFVISKPIFADNEQKPQVKEVDSSIYIQKNFEENIKNKYAGSYVNFPYKGIAHIRKIKYINSKPIKINIVEINTKVNPDLKIKPQIASQMLNSKSTVRRMAQKENSIVALNASFFKPQTGVPLGALMINKEVLTGPIYNRVGIAIFEEDGNTFYKMSNISFDINAVIPGGSVKIDNINQPRMSAGYLLMYTSAWSKISPPPPKDGLNLLIRDSKPIKISANPVEITKDDVILQGNKEIITKLGKQSAIKINISLQDDLKNAKHIIGAGPYLVKNSNLFVDYKEQKLQAIAGKNPRSAIGYTSDNTLILVTIDGREQNSVGMTLIELGRLMKGLGCVNAMNFDGGSSSALYVKGKIVNNAVNKEGIPVASAIVVNKVNSNNLQLSSL